MSIKTLADPGIAYPLAHEEDWADAYITVFAPGTLFVETDERRLTQLEGGNQQGIQLTAANTTGNSSPYRLHFIGTAYGRGSVGKMQVDVTVFARRRSAGESASGADIRRPRCP
jgi:hypothetical protein